MPKIDGLLSRLAPEKKIDNSLSDLFLCLFKSYLKRPKGPAEESIKGVSLLV